jgi:uncharacterized membrane protein
MRRTLLLSLLLLSACGRETPPAPPEPEAPPPTISDFSGAIDARGTEPFWAVKVRGTQLTLSRPDAPDLIAEAPGATIRPGTATWTGKAADGTTLKLTLYVSPCLDGMSDLRYPMSAEVTLPGVTYSGCAAKTAQMPREGR